ncbi:MAG: ribbon-helix-helix protein, CopG family [Opitutus sp.]|nr:ribbon-helix-helix protein, CopG family [Opitutus sp.]
MPTLTLKVSSEFKARLSRAARKRKVSVSELVRTSVEKEVPADGRGWLLGACAHVSAGPSTYDPAKPVFDEKEWEMLKP